MQRSREIRSDAGVKVPIHFASARGRVLFGFHHAPREGVPARDSGVVLCAPIGTDHVRSEWVYRRLAERLAAAGFACLRFDLSGTGDSADVEGDPARAWKEDVGAAIDELRARSGVRHVSLFGLRLGALVALAHAAERGGVDSVVLWSPCASGAGFVAETTRLHALYTRIEPHVAKAAPPPAGSTEALGLQLTPELVSALGTLDAGKLTGKIAARALVIDGGNVAGLPALVEGLRARGTTTDVEAHAGHKFLVTVSHRQVLPEEPLAAVVRWLDHAHPELGPGPTSSRPIVGGPHDERPVVFGRAHPLFGILTPADPAASRPDRPAIVVANAGCVNRQGPHAMFVRGARRWARLGFDVLRIDVSGIGDSPAGPGAKENLTYPPSGEADLVDAIRATGRKAIVAGLCSGGDYAFQLGAHGPDVAGAWILNPRTFGVLDLTAVESGTPPTTPVGDVPRTLRGMAERGLDTTLVVSRGDPGVAYVDANAGGEMRGLSSVDGFARFDLEGADHPFTPVSVQAQVLDLLTDRLAARH